MLVSTGTKNLQEQIFFKDLPVLRAGARRPLLRDLHEGARQLPVPAPVRRAARDGAAIRSRDEAIAIDTIDEWSRRTETGDRAEIEDLPEDLPFWPEIAATAENCLGTRLSAIQRLLRDEDAQRAAESDVVIVNHHLLCADAAVRQSAFGEVIPVCRYAIVDEAHQLEDVATQYFGISVSNYRVDELCRDAEASWSRTWLPNASGKTTCAATSNGFATKHGFFLGASDDAFEGGLGRGNRYASAHRCWRAGTSTPAAWSRRSRQWKPRSP